MTIVNPQEFVNDIIIPSVRDILSKTKADPQDLNKNITPVNVNIKWERKISATISSYASIEVLIKEHAKALKIIN